MNGWLEGYSALITGGGTGIGRAVAERFLAEGASVTILGRNKHQLDDVVDGSIDPARMHAVAADVRDSTQLHVAVDEAVARFGKLDTLVANAGMWDYQRHLTRLSGQEVSDTFDEVFAVNVKGYFLDDPYEGLLLCHFADLFGNWKEHPEGKDAIWKTPRRKRRG